MTVKTQQAHHNIDLLGLLLLNWGLQPLTADPATTYARLYFNSVSGKIRVYNTVTSAWEDLGADTLDTEAVQDLVAGMLDGTQSGVTVAYNDTTGKLTLTVTDAPLLGGQNGAYYLARANHTGTQLAATISDLNSAVSTIVNAMTLDADTLQGDTVSDIVTAAVNQITNGAGAAYDTLIEIQAFLQDQDTDIAALMTSLGTKAGRYSETIGDGTTADIVVTHNLGTRDVEVTCRDAASPYAAHSVYWEATTTNTVTIFFPTAPTAGQFRITVLG